MPATEIQSDSTVSNTRKSHVLRGMICASIGCVCWGFSGTCIQLLTTNLGVSVMWVTTVRMLLSAVLFLAICLVREPGRLKAALLDRRSLVTITLFSLLGVLFMQIAYMNAIKYTTAGIGTLLEQLGLALIMLYVCIRGKRLPHGREIIGLVIAMGGTFIIATQGNPLSLAIPTEGLFWGLLSALAFMFYTLMPIKVLAKWGSFIVTGLAMLIGGVVAALFEQPWNEPVAMSGELIFAMAVLVVVGTLIAYVLYLQGIQDAGPMRASLTSPLEPVSAMVLATVWLGSPITVPDMIGGLLIVAMVFLVSGSSDSENDSTAYSGVRDDLPLFQGRASLVGSYQSRLATRDGADRKALNMLLEQGRQTMSSLGIKEGTKKYPSPRRLVRAINEEAVYVITRPVSESERQSVRDRNAANSEAVAAVVKDQGSSAGIVFETSNEPQGVVSDASGEQRVGVKPCKGVLGRFQPAKSAEEVIGMFCLDTEADPAYEQAIDVTWPSSIEKNVQTAEVLIRENYAADASRYAVLRWVQVTPRMRHCGIGSYILGRAETLARSDGKVGIRCDVFALNTPMRQLLTKHGYMECGRIEMHSRFGATKDRVVYEKLLK